MPYYNLESSEVQISPTVLSSDLVTPAVPRKVTLPSVGVFRRPNNVTSWGSESIKYGGIGKLPLLTKTSQAVNYDVVTSRSHKHYSSRVNNYNACSQPYAVTSLSLSGCRMNDQLLPAPLNTEHGKLDEPWPGHPYTSHMCQFDVFPRFDPVRTKFDVPCGRKLKQKLNPATEEALENLSKRIYRTPVYQENIKELPKPSPTVPIDLITIQNENKMPIGMENWQVNDQEELDRNETREEDEEDNETEESKEYCERKSEGKLDNEKVPTDSASSAVWPIWPVRKTPLNYPKIPLPVYTPLDFSKRDQSQNSNNCSHVSGEQTAHCLQLDAMFTKSHTKKHATFTNQYVPALTAYRYSSLGLEDSKHLKFTSPETKNLKEMQPVHVSLVPVKHPAGVDYVRLPLIGQEKATEQSREPPPKNHCATRMLGIRFKTDAHRRYNTTYTNVVPDLRDSVNTGRRHFFWGIHACALR